MNSNDYIQLDETYGAHNYHPLDVVIERAQGVWVLSGINYEKKSSHQNLQLRLGHRPEAILAQRDAKLAAARDARKIRRNAS